MKLRFSIIVSVLAALFTSNVALAQQFTLLPVAEKDADCAFVLNKFELDGKILDRVAMKGEVFKKASSNYDDVVAATAQEYGSGDSIDEKKANMEAFCAKEPAGPACTKIADAKSAKDSAFDSTLEASGNNNDGRANLLGCAIKTGRISLQMIPYFISYISNFLLSIIGLICVLFIVLGGYFYIAAGLTEGKEKGKKYISHALLGMAVAILSWIIVNVVMYAVTS